MMNLLWIGSAPFGTFRLLTWNRFTSLPLNRKLLTFSVDGTLGAAFAKIPTRRNTIITRDTTALTKALMPLPPILQRMSLQLSNQTQE